MDFLEKGQLLQSSLKPYKPPTLQKSNFTICLDFVGLRKDPTKSPMRVRANVQKAQDFVYNVRGTHINCRHILPRKKVTPADLSNFTLSERKTEKQKEAG